MVKDAVNIPVIIQGRLQNPEDAERMLEEGKADFVAMGRAWIAEPNWVNKIACGGHPFVPGIKGIKDCKNVVTGPDVLTGKAETEGHVLIAGGGQAGVETAYQLLTEGK